MTTKIISAIAFIVLAATILLSPVAFCTATAETVADCDLADVRQQLVNWKKSSLGIDAEENLLGEEMLSLSGSTPGDWYPFGLARAGMSDNFDGYKASVNDYVSKKYDTDDKLSKAKATEWHRISLALTACGGNPRRAGNNGDIDLIADGTYNRVDGNGKGILGRQGINGYIWALIALDSKMYAVPEKAYYDRGDIIVALLGRQLADGGWSLVGSGADPDITAMCVTALAPYYNSEVRYTYVNKNIDNSGAKITSTVRQCVDKALFALGQLQQDDGDFISWGTQNCESTVWVVVALCSLGRDPSKEADFIKNGKTLVDGILKYRNSDGGFIHSFTYDAENPSSSPDKSNTMTGEQVLYGLTSLLRLRDGNRRLFDLRNEQPSELKMQIDEVISEINLLDENAELQQIVDTYAKYRNIETSERSYVTNYHKLSALLEKSGVEYEQEDIRYNERNDDVQAMFEFTDVDRQSVDNLPTVVTLQYKAEVVRLWAKINNCFDFDGKQVYVAKLDLYKNRIDELESEIASLAADIKEKLYPFDNITLADKDVVYALYARYEALSEYDKTRLESTDVEGLVRAKTQVDNLTVAALVSAAAVVIIAALTVFVVFHVRARRKKRAAEKMPESEE